MFGELQAAAAVKDAATQLLVGQCCAWGVKSTFLLLVLPLFPSKMSKARRSACRKGLWSVLPHLSRLLKAR